jgi:hypothetical protein
MARLLETLPYVWTKGTIASSQATQEYRHRFTTNIKTDEANTYIAAIEYISPTMLQVKTRIFIYP